MAEYNINAHKPKNGDDVEKKKVEKVIKGAVITKKKTASKKFLENFISDDADNVIDSVFSGVLVPAMKDTFFAMISTGFEMLLYGETKSGSRRSGYGGGTRTSYDRYYGKPEPRDGRAGTRVSMNDKYSCDDIILDTRAEAEEVIDCMAGLIDRYGMVSVLDLKDLVGLSTTPSDKSYGWFDLRTARTERVRDGYLLKFPRKVLID